jgi:ferredoxin--NADP+ reductase
MAGWSREASSGLVGVARKDGENGAQALMQYLQSEPPVLNRQVFLDDLHAHLDRLGKPIVRKPDLLKLAEAENAEATRLGLPDFKFCSNEEMFTVLGLN